MLLPFIFLYGKLGKTFDVFCEIFIRALNFSRNPLIINLSF